MKCLAAKRGIFIWLGKCKDISRYNSIRKSQTQNPKLEIKLMHILVTNDDGVQAPGLLALAQEMRKLGKVTVFAPDRI